MTIDEALELIEPAPRVSLARQIEDEFAPYEAKFEEWKQKSASIKVNNINDVEAMAMAKTLEKFVGKALSSLEKRRKELKAESLEVGRAIDSAAKRFKEVLEPLREELKAKAEFKERYEREQAEAKRMFRTNSLLQYGVLLDAEMIRMSDSDFEQVVADAKIAYEKKLELEKITEERIGFLLSENLMRFATAENSKDIGSLSDEEFLQLQSDFKQKLKHEEEEKSRLQKANQLYQERIQIIQSKMIAEYIGDSMKNIGVMEESEFNSMIEVAVTAKAEKTLADLKKKTLNDARLAKMSGFPIPSFLNLDELYLYSDEEFGQILMGLHEEKKKSLALAIRRQSVQDFSDWKISDKELSSMSEDDFTLELNERRRRLKEEANLSSDGRTEKEKALEFVAWLRTYPSIPDLQSEGGLELISQTKELYRRMAGYIERISEGL